jgi:3-methyladenine DNA glycosylase/8-oxoguanine DNA glycosylase
MSNEYTSEINYIKRKIPTTKAEWTSLPALCQIATKPSSMAEVQKIIAALKDAFLKKIEKDIKDLAAKGLGKTANEIFEKMVSSVTSKLNGSSRAIINVNLLRQLFGNEIDTDFGGGGKSYNPFSNKPKPPGRGI